MDAQNDFFPLIMCSGVAANQSLDDLKYPALWHCSNGGHDRHEMHHLPCRGPATEGQGGTGRRNPLHYLW